MGQAPTPRSLAAAELQTSLGVAGAIPWWDRLVPRSGVRAQLVAAATLWLVGLSFLLVRGVLFLEVPGPDFHPNYALVPVAAIAVTVGIVKARLVILGYARKAVARIEARGHSCFFGFFAPASWLFIAVMMGRGILLRNSFLADSGWGRALLSVLYIAVGTALLIGDRVFWRAGLRREDAA